MSQPTPLCRIGVLTILVWLLAVPSTSHAQIYRCGNSYSSEPCAGGKAVSVEPLVEVHPDPATPPTRRTTRRSGQKEAQEARAWERTERELDKAQAASAPQRQAPADRSQCQAKQQRIQKIDELARRGGSAKQMERLREERQTARDWQFRAGC